MINSATDVTQKKYAIMPASRMRINKIRVFALNTKNNILFHKDV